ncbi:MAG TPA: MFS transporter [Methylophilaceae bacterium]|jgi:MFS family permease
MQLPPHLNCRFLQLLSFRVQLVLAYQIMAVVVGWHIYQLTRDPLALGLVGLAEVMPYFASALFAGHAVDHYSRRLFGVMSALILFVIALTLVAVSQGWLHGDATLWIYGATAVTGFARAFIAPSYGAMFSLVLQRSHYAKAAGFGSSMIQFGMVAGPAIGGLLVGFFSTTVAYLVAMLLCFGAAVSLFTLKVKEPPPADSAPVLRSIAEGLRFVYRNQVLFGAQCLDMFAVLFGGAVALLPAFVQEVFDYGPEGLGILRAAPSIGAVITGLYLARNPIDLHAGRWLLGAVAGFGVCIIIFALSGNFWLATFMLLLAGICDGISVVLRATIFQLVTPDHMRGRVSAINGIFIGSSNELGAFESGLAARLLGLVPSVVFGGLMTLGVVGVTARLAPKLRRLSLSQLQ